MFSMCKRMFLSTFLAHLMNILNSYLNVCPKSLSKPSVKSCFYQFVEIISCLCMKIIFVHLKSLFYLYVKSSSFMCVKANVIFSNYHRDLMTFRDYLFFFNQRRLQNKLRSHLSGTPVNCRKTAINLMNIDFALILVECFFLYINRWREKYAANGLLSVHLTALKIDRIVRRILHDNEEKYNVGMDDKKKARLGYIYVISKFV